MTEKRRPTSSRDTIIAWTEGDDFEAAGTAIRSAAEHGFTQADVVTES